MDFWDKTAGVYDLAEMMNGRVWREMTELTERLIPRGSRVLDCAAGTGNLSLAAAKKAESVLCTDLSHSMLRTAKAKAKAMGITNISFERKNIFHLEENDESYDAVIAGNVLHLLTDPKRAVEELWRVTKKGGRILLPTFCTKDMGSVLLKVCKLAGFRPEKEYTPRELLQALKGCVPGRLKARVIDGLVPCCYAVIYKDL